MSEKETKKILGDWARSKTQKEKDEISKRIAEKGTKLFEVLKNIQTSPDPPKSK